jgi:thiol-disulfide isomerase/thioredoxin
VRRKGPLRSAPPLAVLLTAALLSASGTIGAQGPGGALGHALTRIEAPAQAPDFVLEDMDGGRHALSQYRGKVVLLNLWATWCPPCREEMPSLERLYRRLQAEGFQVLAVNQWESPDHVFSYLGQLEVHPSFPVLFDRDSRVAEALRVKGLPTSFLLDRQGRIAYRAVGGRDFDHPDVERTVRELLAASDEAAGAPGR